MSDLLASLKALIHCARQLKQAQAAQVGRPSDSTAKHYEQCRELSDKAVGDFWAAMEQAKAALAECGGNPFVTQWIEELADHSPKAGSTLGAVAMSNTWARSLDELREIANELTAGRVKRPQRRRQRTEKVKGLTAIQLEAVQIVGECKGNIAEAGRKLGRDRKTVEQNYRAATKKLGKSAVKHATKGMPSDRRGQCDITEDDDYRRL